MRYAIYTRSGARYLIDEGAMTWQRDGSASNQDVVAGVDRFLHNDGRSGRLYAKPDIKIGHRAAIVIGPNPIADYIYCTEIQRIELVME